MMEPNNLLKEQLHLLHLDIINQSFAAKAVEYRKKGLDYVEYLADLVNEQVRHRQNRSLNQRIGAAHFPWIKVVEDFDFAYNKQPSRSTWLDLGQLQFLQKKENVVLIGPPGVGKTHLAISLGVKACEALHRVLFITAADLVTQLNTTKRANLLPDLLSKLSRLDLLIIDELGYLPIDAEEANLFFQVISRKYEKSSLILTTNKPFDEWGEIFKDPVLAAALLDRLLHHAHIIKITGKSYRMKGKEPAKPSIPQPDSPVSNSNPG